ncbi:hypothetical protein E2C01_079334 [Portunus trituberculatus]|uniref:Uncharacterized protein n=1 Tax=Portunus trituberculatus TaxID=210409 RepID=A0A5B7IL95_PORTR|nr:hypothetical protein [Portunus trituberculatus]
MAGQLITFPAKCCHLPRSSNLPLAPCLLVPPRCPMVPDSARFGLIQKRRTTAVKALMREGGGAETVGRLPMCSVTDVKW